MKTLRLTLMVMFAMFFMASCSEDSDNSEQMTNYVTLEIKGESQMTEDNTDGIDVTVGLAYAMDKDVQVTLSLTGDEMNAVRLEPQTVNFPAGEKSATVKVLSNNANVLVQQEVVFVRVEHCSDTKMAAINPEGVAVTVKPNIMIAELTEEQKALIEGYKTNLGIDLYRILGFIDVETTITYGNDDKDAENAGNDTRVIKGTSVITLSEHATAEKPVLKMTSNPMGMESYMYEKLLRCTTEDPDGYFESDPVAVALKEAANYDKSKEEFSVVLDNIELNADGTLNFTAMTEDFYGDDITLIPFDYTYSVWTRLNEKAQSGETVYVNDGDTNVEYTILELLEQYNTFNPRYYLGCTDISYDYYENEPSNYVAPSSQYDFNNGTMTFDFAWDYGAGMFLYDYIHVHVTYTMK